MSVITTRFLMRPVFHKFLKFWKVRRNFRHRRVWVGQADFEKIYKNRRHRFRSYQRQSFDPDMTYNQPANFQHGWTFSFLLCAGIIPEPSFRHFDPTLAGPMLDQTGPSGILLNRSHSLATVVCESDSPTSSRSAEDLAGKEKKAMRQMTQEEQRAQVMNFKPWFGWARNGPCVRRNTNSTYVPPSSYKTTFRIDMYSFTQLWYRMKKVNICCCCMSIICRSRLAKAKQNAWFGFMLITAQYAPEMKSDQLCLFDQFMYFGSATQKLCHIFRLFRLRFQLFEEFFGCLIFWGTVVRPGPFSSSTVRTSRDCCTQELACQQIGGMWLQNPLSCHPCLDCKLRIINDQIKNLRIFFCRKRAIFADFSKLSKINDKRKTLRFSHQYFAYMLL